MWQWLIPILIILIIFIRVKSRGFFWKAKNGEQLTFKQFLKRWKQGVEGINPLQQTKTTLWSFLPMFAGILWGITITIMGKTFWLSLILLGSLPITTIQFVSNLQKYWRLKTTYKAMEELKKPKKKK